MISEKATHKIALAIKDSLVNAEDGLPAVIVILAIALILCEDAQSTAKIVLQSMAFDGFVTWENPDDPHSIVRMATAVRDRITIEELLESIVDIQPRSENNYD